jgi:hypothetical protein
MQGWLVICKSLNAIQLINRIKNKNHMITSIDVEKAFDIIQHAFLIKATEKLGIEGSYLNIIKGIYNKPIVNNILNGEKLTFPVMSRMSQSVHCLHSYSI